MQVSGKTDLQDDASTEGLPVAHEVVRPGNAAQARTLLSMIRELLALYPLNRAMLIANRDLLRVSNIEGLGKLQTLLKKDRHEVSVEYILAVQAVRYGDFVADLPL